MHVWVRVICFASAFHVLCPGVIVSSVCSQHTFCSILSLQLPLSLSISLRLPSVLPLPLLLLPLQEFRTYYESTGWVVNMPPGGYMTRYKSGSSPMAALCVHGGTTATVVVVLDGRYILIANVGDSTALLTGFDNPAVIKNITEWPVVGAAATPVLTLSPAGADLVPPPGPVALLPGAADPSPHILLVAPSGPAPAAADERASSFGAAVPESQRFLELSADHSPESPSEFYRMRNFRPCPHRMNQPELLFVYDTLSSSKLSCPPVFLVDASGVASKTGRGSYYKNVRNEWATLVATPPYCQFQDALAFTRSLGDLHLQTYGVS